MRSLTEAQAAAAHDAMTDALDLLLEHTHCHTERALGFRLIHDRIMHKRHEYGAEHARRTAEALRAARNTLTGTPKTLRTSRSAPVTPTGATRATPAAPHAA